jgi:UDP-2,3-diacylglucosamine hydrolase
MAEPTGQDGAGRTVGLLCGGGDLPLYMINALHARGHRVVAVGIRGEADPDVIGHADEVHWGGIAQIGRWIRAFKKAGVRAMLMVGGVRKRRMFDNKLAMIPDLRTVRFYYRKITSREDHTLLGAMAEEFEDEGISVRSVIDYCPELLVHRGCLTRTRPTRRQWADIRFAWPLIKKIAALQIGQTIVVKHLAVLAVEAIDGTDRTLERGGGLGRGGPLRRGGAVAVKVAREKHDVRFDIPCIGPKTVDILKRSGIKVLAVEAGRTILLGPEAVRSKADAAGVCIVAVTEQDVSGDGT